MYFLCFFNTLFNTSFDFQEKANSPDDSLKHLLLFGPNVAKLAGNLSLGYFTHAFILPIIKNNEKQENNRRDLFIGYLMAFFTYLLIGILGYIGFSGVDYDEYFRKSGKFADNWFLFYEPDNILILFFRFLSVIQLCTIFPILCYVTRIQFFGTFWNNAYPSVKHVATFNLGILITSVIILFYCYNILGSLIGFIGAGTGLFLIYVIPFLINVIYYKLKHPNKYDELIGEKRKK